MTLSPTELHSLTQWFRRPRALAAVVGVAATVWFAAPRLAIPDTALSEVNDTQAETLIDLEDRPVVVEFVVPGCPFCRGSSRLLRQVAADTGDSVRYAQIDMNEHTRLADRFAVQAVPTILVFHNRVLMGRTSMIESKAALDRLLAGP